MLHLKYQSQMMSIATTPPLHSELKSFSYASNQVFNLANDNISRDKYAIKYQPAFE